MKSPKLSFFLIGWQPFKINPALKFLAGARPIFGKSLLLIAIISSSFLMISAIAFAQSSPRIQFQSAFKDYNACIIPTEPEAAPDFLLSAKNINATIPPNLKPTENAGEVASKFGDQALQNWLKSEAVKSSPLGRKATQVENAMRTEVVVKNNSASSTDHRFSLQVMALQALTKLEYKGWLNASLNYNARASETELEVKDKIWNKKEIFVNHKTTPIEGQSTMGVRWDW